MTENREPYHLSGKPRPTTRIAPTNYAETAIGVFTAAVGALGTLFAFANKYLDIEGFLKNFKLPFWALTLLKRF